MTSTRPKHISGQEFNGKDQLVFEDIQDWIVPGFGEGSKQQLDEMDWEGDAIVSVGLFLSTDNRKITSGKIYTHGELMRSNKDFRAQRLFEKADKDLRIYYQIEDFATFKFNNGTLIGDMVDCMELAWHVEKKVTGAANTVVAPSDYVDHGIGNFSIRPFIVPLSGKKAKTTIVCFPLTSAELQSEHPLSRNPSFPGLELTSFEVNLFPPSSPDQGKD